VSTWPEELGQKIREARKLAGLTQKQLAQKTSVSRPQLSNYENGVSDAPARVVAEIAEALKAQFVVHGCRIGPDRVTPELRAPQQLCLEFGKEHEFPKSTVTIKPSSKAIVITAVLPRVNKSAG
jgi:transcriptional regulator with XRE-family HTH domain